MDDTLHPQIIKLGNRYYRNNICPVSHNDEYEEYLDEEPFDLTENSHAPDELNLGLIRLSMPIKTTDKGCSGKTITITGENKANLVSACNRIAAKVAIERKKAEPNHFLSIPLSEPIAEAYNKLKEELVNKKEKYKFDENDLMKLSKVHFTICTMFLADDDEVTIAKNIIKEFVLADDFAGNFRQGSIRLTVKGLEIMNDDLCRARVVYAKPLKNEALDRLQVICDQLKNLCSDSGLLAGQNSTNVKIHMTVLNAKRSAKKRLEASLSEEELVKWKSGSRRAFSKQLHSQMSLIDATEIFKCFSQYTFAKDFPLKEIQLNVRGVPGDIYPFVASILLPQQPRDSLIFMDS
ncbi:activating signal cointegrator 1 complex subunit [Cichlidogyrus casuarinus]|uniref:Activating signal cointegrator 1 complex subunit n=1 Tax=Cichlidogyrus casuarinus TaxID=1844966 RepID=A0ABD2Q5M3_9PLAT